MSVAEAKVVARKERRRSERFPLALSLTVRGVSINMRPFQEETFTLSVSAHGALLALNTTVTLGQTLFVTNPQTQDKLGAWVTRFGSPRGHLVPVGIEFAKPDGRFWTGKGQAGTLAERAAERRAEQQIHILPDPVTKPAVVEGAVAETSETSSAATAAAAATVAAAPPVAETVASSPAEAVGVTAAAGSVAETAAGAASHVVLLQALEQTLQQAAEKAVASAAEARLGGAVNQAAEAIENFSKGRMHQLEEQLAQYCAELRTSAAEEFRSGISGDISQNKEELKSRAVELLEEAAREAHGNFDERLRETANQAASRFGDEAAGSLAQRFAGLGEQLQASAQEAQSRVDSATAALGESQEKVKSEIERTVGEALQRMEALNSQSKELHAEWDARVNTYRAELTQSKEQELERFRESLRDILTTLLNSLG